MENLTYQDIKKCLFLIFLFIISFAVYFFLSGTVPQLLGYNPSIIYKTIVFSLASPIGTLPLIIFLRKKWQIQIISKLTLPNIQTIFLLFLLSVSSIILTRPLSNIIEFIVKLGEGSLKFLIFVIPQFNIDILIKMIGAGILAPIFEEILFRKIILGHLLKKYSASIAIIISSVFFALGHLRFYDIGTLTIWGIILGFIYFKTNSIGAAILLHSFIGLLTFFIQDEFIEFSGHLFLIYFSLTLIFVTMVVLIVKYFNNISKT